MPSTEEERELIKQYTRRLQKLRERKAREGISSDPKIEIEIEDIEVEIEKLRTKDDIREILSLCYKRAIFTKYHAQIDGQEDSKEAMFKSLDDCRLSLQKMQGGIESKKLQQNVAGIIRDLDLIERQKQIEFSEASILIDDAKLRIIKVLRKLSKEVDVPYTLPQSLTGDVFFTKEEADGAPVDFV